MQRRKLVLFALSALLPSASVAYDPASVIEAVPGTLPLLLTVPHDGGDFLGMYPSRTRGATVRDVGTRDLARAVSERLFELTGRRPYLVVAKFTRRQLDANRAQADAMESEGLLPAYRAYHDQVAAYVGEIRAAFPDGSLLIDVHGQGDEPDTTFRGTRAGLTTSRLVARFGPAAIQGPDSIVGALAAKGYPVNPAPDAATLREDPRFAGGYTVFTYGSHRPVGIDAIQLEFGRQHRANRQLADDFAGAILQFMKAYGLLAR